MGTHRNISVRKLLDVFIQEVARRTFFIFIFKACSPTPLHAVAPTTDTQMLAPPIKMECQSKNAMPINIMPTRKKHTASLRYKQWRPAANATASSQYTNAKFANQKRHGEVIAISMGFSGAAARRAMRRIFPFASN